MSFVEQLAAARWKCRTDLFWLTKEVLGYKDVTMEVHGPIFAMLQQFEAPPRAEWGEFDKVTSAGCAYRPWKPIRSLAGGRRRLILDPRGHFKTTINVIAHSIQWILNYPEEISALIVHSKQEVAEDILAEIKEHFAGNRKLRDLFPELATSGKQDGGRRRYMCPVTKRAKEGTVAASSIETTVAGYHYHVIKFTDVVTELNSGSKEQRDKVTRGIGMYRNVLIAPEYWMDIEGTTYDFDDTYSRIIEEEAKLQPSERQWKIHVRGAYKKDTGGRPYTFLPEERELPDLMVDGQRLPWFPEKFPLHELERMRKDPTVGEALFAAQQMNYPIMVGDSMPFPLHTFKTKSMAEIRKIPFVTKKTTVDTAETDGKGSDFSVILTCGRDAFGRRYVIDVRYGKFLPDRLIAELFDVHLMHRPQQIRVEETGFVRGLKTSIRRQEDKIGIYLPFVFSPRDNQASKQERILLTLQPWFSRGEIFWLDTIPCLDQAKQQLTRFPKGKDDILDALADQFQEEEWLGRMGPSKDAYKDPLKDEEAYGGYVKEAILKAQDELLKPPFEEEMWGPV